MSDFAWPGKRKLTDLLKHKVVDQTFIRYPQNQHLGMYDGWFPLNRPMSQWEKDNCQVLQTSKTDEEGYEREFGTAHKLTADEKLAWWRAKWARDKK